MSFILIFAGLLFTLNPMLGLIDILPDLIGFMLIYIGVSRLSAVSVELEDSLSYIKWAAIISLGRALISLGSGGFDDTMRLCLSMVLSVLEFGVMIFVLGSLSDGLSYLSIRYCGSSKEDGIETKDGGENAFIRLLGLNENGTRRGESPEFRIIGLIFFGARGFFSVLPQIGVLWQRPEGDGSSLGDTLAMEWVHYSSMLTVLNVIITLAVAVFWFLSIRGYIGAMAADRELNSAIGKAFSEKRSAEPGYFIRRRLTLAFRLLAVAGVFLIDFIGDGVNFIPDPVFALLSLAAALALSPYCGEQKRDERGRAVPSPEVKRAVYCGAAYFALSCLSFAYCNHFAKSRYFLSFSTMVITYTAEYMLTILLALLEGVALVMYIRALLPLLSFVADGHLGLEVPEEFVRTRDENEQTRTTVKKKLRWIFILSCAVAASGVAFTVTLQLMPEYWMIHLALNAALYALLLNTVSQYQTEIKARYAKPGE